MENFNEDEKQIISRYIEYINYNYEVPNILTYGECGTEMKYIELYKIYDIPDLVKYILHNTFKLNKDVSKLISEYLRTTFILTLHESNEITYCVYDIHSHKYYGCYFYGSRRIQDVLNHASYWHGYE